MNPKPRASEPTREDEQRRKAWQPPNELGVLADLHQDPDWAYRWTNQNVQGQTELATKNFLKKLQEGWVPVKPSDHPLFSLPQNQLLVVDGKIQRPGQVLMRMPKYMAEQRNAHWRNEDARQRGVNRKEQVQKEAPQGWSVQETSSHQSIPLHGG